LISFGFALAKIFYYLHEQKPEQTPLVSAATIGTLIILIGLIALVLAGIQHGRALKALRAQCPALPVSLGWVLVVLLALLGTLALVVAILRW
jgi:putative membrane protein